MHISGFGSIVIDSVAGNIRCIHVIVYTEDIS